MTRSAVRIITPQRTSNVITCDDLTRTTGSSTGDSQGHHDDSYSKCFI